jgi:ergothioneine biosynthesis protein EgtB
VGDDKVQHPLYWCEGGSAEFTLRGRCELEADRPVCHLSFFEAHAFARWAGARLPTEYEWEIAAQLQPVTGVLLESSAFHPRVAQDAGPRPAQIFGDVWEWTNSPHLPYPGYQAPPGALAEYNQKFMCSQMICRGGSCVTPADHIRATYRNFFYPQQRWQFCGLRLARDA